MNSPSAVDQLTSLQTIRNMVSQHLVGSRHSTDVILATIYRHEQHRSGDSAGSAYWHAGTGRMLPCRASVFEEIERLRGRLDGADQRKA